MNIISDIYLSTYFACPGLQASEQGCGPASPANLGLLISEPVLTGEPIYLYSTLTYVETSVVFVTSFLSILLVKWYPNGSFGNIPAPTFHFCGINSNSSSRVGSNWFKPGRGEDDVVEGTHAGSAFGIKSKEGNTCKVPRREG